MEGKQAERHRRLRVTGQSQALEKFMVRSPRSPFPALPAPCGGVTEDMGVAVIALPEGRTVGSDLHKAGEGPAAGREAAERPWGWGLCHSPALAAASTKVPLPWLWKRKLGPFSLSQKISEALLLRMGPTLTPRPPRTAHRPHSEQQKCSLNHLRQGR